jgi:hypothetical protein
MVSRCPRSQMNASWHFARTLNKRNRHQLSRSALAHIHPPTKRLTTLQFAGGGDETVSGKQYKNITVKLAAPSPLSIAFSTKQAICSCEHYQAKLCPSLLTLIGLRCGCWQLPWGFREAARQMGISEDAVRQRSKREGWMACPKAVAQRALAKPVTSVSPVALSPAHALANVFSERKHRTKLGLSKYAAEAAEEAGEHPNKLSIAGKVKDVASVHTTLWPEGPKTNEILPGSGILIGTMNVIDARTGEVDSGPDKGKFIDLEPEKQ